MCRSVSPNGLKALKTKHRLSMLIKTWHLKELCYVHFLHKQGHRGFGPNTVGRYLWPIASSIEVRVGSLLMPWSFTSAWISLWACNITHWNGSSTRTSMGSANGPLHLPQLLRLGPSLCCVNCSLVEDWNS